MFKVITQYSQGKSEYLVVEQTQQKLGNWTVGYIRKSFNTGDALKDKWEAYKYMRRLESR